MNTFLTIQAPAEGLYKEKGSKFLAFAYPVSSEEEVKMHLHRLKEEHHKARHHCYAYRMGKDGAAWKANDAGEPPNTAGPPILNQIKSFNLTNILVVVVRYFGGTKLGVSGLITAYKLAAADALEQAAVVEDYEKKTIRVETAYDTLSEVMNFIKNKNVNLQKQEFGPEISLQLEVPEEDYMKLKEGLEQLKKTRIL